MAAHKVFDEGLEFFGYFLAFKRHRLFAVDVYRRDRHFALTWQRDADIGMLGLARAVDLATHHRHLHGFDAGILAAPHGLLGTQIGFDILRQFLEYGGGGAAAASI